MHCRWWASDVSASMSKFIRKVFIGQTWRTNKAGRTFIIKNVWRKDEMVHIMWADTGDTEAVSAYWMRNNSYPVIMYV